jgi:hypothetical protein
VGYDTLCDARGADKVSWSAQVFRKTTAQTHVPDLG